MKTRLIDNKETLIERREREKNNKKSMNNRIVGIPIPKTFVDRHLGFFFILGVLTFSLLYMFLALIQIGVI